MKIYSHSKLETFEQCKLKFKFRYIDKIISETKSIEAHLGHVVHKTLEWLYNQIEKEKIPTIEQIVSYYSEKWQEEFSKDIVIVKKEFTKKDYFRKGVQFLIDYYTENYPFNDNTIAIEEKIELKLAEEIKLIGFIDRLVHNLEKDEYEIHDYKTSNFLPTQESIDTDRQLALYSIAIKELFGKDKPVLLTWHYLAHNMKIHSKRTDEQLEQLKKEILELIKKIESTTEFSPNKSILCGWCEYKNICPIHGGKPPKSEHQTEGYFAM